MHTPQTRHDTREKAQRQHDPNLAQDIAHSFQGTGACLQEGSSDREHESETKHTQAAQTHTKADTGVKMRVRQE